MGVAGRPARIAALGALSSRLPFAFFMLELGLIATLQAFILRPSPRSYLGGATARSLTRQPMDLQPQARVTGDVTKAGSDRPRRRRRPRLDRSWYRIGIIFRARRSSP